MAETIRINNSKGGVAKSTSVITLSQILAIAGYKILIIDLDPQMNTTKMYGQDENPDVNIEHLFCTKQLRKSSVEEFITPTSQEGISIISASRSKLYPKDRIRKPDCWGKSGLLLGRWFPADLPH